jgi:hypothetical protein
MAITVAVFVTVEEIYTATITLEDEEELKLCDNDPELFLGAICDQDADKEVFSYEEIVKGYKQIL